MTTTKTTHEITIVYGANEEHEKTYIFNTLNELHAFVKGVQLPLPKIYTLINQKVKVCTVNI